MGSGPAKNPRGDRRRAAILDAAKAVFIEHGYANASLDDVIRRSGGSRATLYRQFGDKDGLFAAIIERIGAEMVAPLRSFSADQDPETVLLSFGRSFMSALMEPSGLALYRVLIGEGERHPELAKAVYRSGPMVAVEQLAALLGCWHAEKRISVSGPDMAARHFLEMVKGDLHFRALLRLDSPSDGEIDACVKSAVQLFVSGVAKRN